MNECPTRERIGVPPDSRTTSGTAREQMRLCTTLPARVARPRIAWARIASWSSPRPVTAWSSTRNTRSASPSNARPTSASSLTTRALQVLEVLRLDRVGRVVRERAVELGEEHRRARTGSPENTAGTTRPPTPFAVSATTRSGRSASRSTNERTWATNAAEQVATLDPAGLLGPLEQTLGDHGLDLAQAGVLADRRRAGPAELDAVVLRGVVARGEHRGRRVEAPRREVDEVGGGEAEVDDVGAGQTGAVDERVDERLRRRAGVAADEHAVGAGEAHERVADAARDRLVDLVGDRCRGCRRP